MKSRSPLLKEAKLSNTPKHIFSNTRSLLKLQVKPEVAKLAKRKSDERNPPNKNKKSLNTTHDFLVANRYLSEQNKCNTTPTQRNEHHQTALNYLVSKITEKENQTENHDEEPPKTNSMLANQQNQIIKQILSKHYQTATTSPGQQSYCENHPKKKAKYLIELTNTYLCSKCSIEKASLGLKVIEINGNSRSPRRPLAQKKHASAGTPQAQLTKIKTISLSNYNSLQVQDDEDSGRKERRECIDKFKSALNNVLEEISQKPSQLISQFDQIFNKMIQELLKVRAIVVKDLELKGELNSMRESIEKMHQDIIENEQNIIQHMSMEPFKEIMGIYEDKISIHLRQMEQNKRNDDFLLKFEELSSQIVKDIQRKFLELVNPNDEVYVSFQNREVFEDALKQSRSKWNVKQNSHQEQNFVQTCEADQQLDEQSDQQLQQCQIGKFQEILLRASERQSQNQQFFQQFSRCNYQRHLFDSESPHFKD